MKLPFWSIIVLLVFPMAIANARTPGERSGAQDEAIGNKSAREAMGLRGLVKTCREEMTLALGQTYTIYYEFRRDGKMLTSRSLNTDGSESVTTWSYDENGRLLKTTSSGKAGEPPDETVYSYDGQGRLASITNSSSKDRTDIHYDEQGHKTEVHRFGPRIKRQNEQVGYSGSSWFAVMAGAGVPDGGTVVVIYDENNRPVEEQVRDAEDQVVSRVVRTYNTKGLVIEEKPIVQNPSSQLAKLPADFVSQMNDAQKQTLTQLMGAAERNTFYAYDAQGRVTKKRQTGVLQSVIATSYNDRGDISEERSTMMSSVPTGVPLSIAENGIVAPTKFVGPAGNAVGEFDTHYSYQYDEYGNWTERKATDAKHPDAPATVHRRTLTYY